jgi:hypothetical protein
MHLTLPRSGQYPPGINFALDGTCVSYQLVNLRYFVNTYSHCAGFELRDLRLLVAHERVILPVKYAEDAFLRALHEPELFSNLLTAPQGLCSMEAQQVEPACETGNIGPTKRVSRGGCAYFALGSRLADCLH